MEIRVSHPNPQSPATSHQAFLPRASSPQSCHPRPVSFPHHVTHTVNLAFALVRKKKADKHRTPCMANSLPTQSGHHASEPRPATLHRGAPHPPLEGLPCHQPPLLSTPAVWGALFLGGQFGPQVLTPNSAGPNSERVVPCTRHPPPPQASSRRGSFTAVCCHGNVAKSDPHG